MTYFMQNGGDDGTVIAYPNQDVGEEIESFLYDMCGHGSAYPFNPVQHKTREELEEDGYDLTNVKEIPGAVIEKIQALVGLAVDGDEDLCDDEDDDEDDEVDYNKIGDEINDLMCEFAVHPDNMLG